MAPAPGLLQAPGGVPWRRPRPVATVAAPPPPAAAAPPPPDPPPPSPFAPHAAEPDGSPTCAVGGGGGHHPPTLLRLAWARYRRQLRARPLLTKSLTAAAVAAASDALAQAVSASSSSFSAASASWRPRYDLVRTLKMALLGLVWGGPSAHFWQAWLHRALPPPAAGSGQAAALANALAKVAVDQLTYGPLCNLVFMAYTSPDKGRVAARLRRDFAGVQLRGWRVWPLAGLLNYRFVPLEHRVLFVNVVALGWSTYLNVKARS